MSAERTIEFTTGPWIKHPEDAFQVLESLNNTRPLDAQIGLEVYATHYFMGAPGPGAVTLDKLRKLQREHGDVPIKRVHLPFHYSLPTAFRRFVTSFWDEPGTLSDRWTSMKVSVATGTVQNGFAIKLAGELGAELNAHVYIVEEAGKRGKTAELTGKSAGILVENDLDYPRKNVPDILRARDPKRAIAAVEKYHLKGVILGLDHTYGYKLDPMEDFSDSETASGLKKHLRSVHLAGSGEGLEGGHGLIDLEDDRFWDFIRFLKMQTFDHDISFCVDINPYAMGKFGLTQQFIYAHRLVEKLEKAA